MTSRPFLTAHWSNIVILTFEAPEHLVRAYLPPGVELDRWNGRPHVSLVALQMLDVRVRRWRIPGFASHPQVNFRTYVRCGADPGVVFVQELVPSRIIAAVGRLWYGEPFRTARIEARVAERADGVRVEYRFGLAALQYRVVVTAARQTTVPPDTSFDHYLKERKLGCRRDRFGRLRTFRVVHPPWAVHPVSDIDWDIDFAGSYGKQWKELNGSAPVSVVLAVGSEVAVHPPRRE